MTPTYKALLAHVAPGTDPRHIQALLQADNGGCALDDGPCGPQCLTPEQAVFCIAMAKACVQVFGADLMEGIARERGI